MIPMARKLTTNRFVLFFKNLKFHLFTKRPVPLLRRQKCENCGFVFNKDLYNACPSCDHGSDVVWIVLLDGKIEGVYRTEKWAKVRVSELYMEFDRKARIENHTIVN